MKCEVCGEDFDVEDGIPLPHYCPNCRTVVTHRSPSGKTMVYVTAEPEDYPKVENVDFSYPVPTSAGLRAFLAKYGLTGAGAAALVGVDSRTVRKWTAPEGSANSRKMPWSAWALIRILAGDASKDIILGEIQKGEGFEKV